jgi:hypothetical protein
MVSAHSARAELVFNLDFGQNGTYDDVWRLRGGELVAIDVYVSNVPEPGLISMGLGLAYDSSIQAVRNGTKVDETNWPFHGDYPDFKAGQIDIGGFRVGSGLSGDNILLATVVFKLDPEVPGNIIIKRCSGEFSCFVLEDDPEPLDNDIPDSGIQLATIYPGYPGDLNWDGVIDLSDGILALKGLVGIWSDSIHANADVNGDGKIGLKDAIFILQDVAEIRE